jgi:hypothetical protein
MRELPHMDQKKQGISKSPQEFFALCCEQRLRGALEMEVSGEDSAEEATRLRLMMAYFDQSCLELSSKRLLEKEDLSLIDQCLLPSGEIHVLPPRPLWLMLADPQPVYGVDPDDPDDLWADERVAALFFRAPFSTEVLRHAVTSPFFELPWPLEDQAPLWYEWRLDLIDPDGIFFSALQYYYDQRTARWRKMEGSTCPWDACRQALDEELGYPTVIACSQCQEAMNYYSRWLATIIQENRGTTLLLKWTTLEIRKRALLSHTKPSGAQPGHRVFKARRRLRKKGKKRS